MTKYLLIAVSALLLAGEAQAITALNHRVPGIVRRIDPEKGIVVITPDAKDEPEAIIVRTEAAEIRCDGKPADWNRLIVGQRVEVHYRKVKGHSTTTELSWKSPDRGETRSPPNPGVKADLQPR